MATRDEVIAILGELDNSVIERILETGASPTEIADALASFDSSLRGDQSMPAIPATGTTVEVGAILGGLTEDEDEGVMTFERPLGTS
ncbi:MAG: hypothetical protein WKG01_02780 [Kofleriaceae bacterium]